jgi:hypothetical protein
MLDTLALHAIMVPAVIVASILASAWFIIDLIDRIHK